MRTLKYILFVCVGNSCRSQMAEGFFNHIAPSGYQAISAGTHPAASVSSKAIEIMAEVGIDISSQRPKLLTPRLMDQAHRIISMGCGVEVCPPAADDWGLDDPIGQPVEKYRQVRDEIRVKVEHLIEELKKMKFERSSQLFQEAQKYLPGGVNSPVRAFKAVGGQPLFIQRGRGSRIYDADGNEYIDYVCSWGPLILGHTPPRVVRALQQAAALGTSFGAPTELETELARLITLAMPSVEKVRFVNSGTEAVMSALRLARAFTQQDRIIKFAGGYHGHADGLLVKGGSGLATLGIPESPGVPAAYAQYTLVCPYNDLEAVKQALAAYPGQMAAVLVEPVAANMGVVPPRPGFLEGLRQLTGEAGAVLIFDEVITGFRLAYGGAQEVYGVRPDLTCLGKVIGGGLPVGAYGGRRDIMSLVAPEGPVYQAGTLSGNPLAMTAGIETLRLLAQPGVYNQLERKGAMLARGLEEAAQRTGLPLMVNRQGSILTVFFSQQPVGDYATALAADTKLYARFFQGMLEQGIYLPPSQFEAWFISLAHTERDIRMTLSAAQEVLSKLV